MPTDTPSLLAAIDAAAELGKAATKRPWNVMTDPPDTVENLVYIVSAANLDHAAIAASLRAKDAEIARLRKVLHHIAYEPIGPSEATYVDVYEDIIKIARSALAPPQETPMPEPTPKPLTAEEITETAVGQWTYKVEGPHREEINSFVHQLADDLRASRAESAALRAALQGIKDYGWDAMEPQALEALSGSMALSESGAGGLLSDRHRAPNTEVDRPDNASSLDTITSLRAAVAAAEKQRDERRERKVLCEQLQTERDALASELAEARKVVGYEGIGVIGAPVVVLRCRNCNQTHRVPREEYEAGKYDIAARDSGKASGGGADGK